MWFASRVYPSFSPFPESDNTLFNTIPFVVGTADATNRRSQVQALHHCPSILLPTIMATEGDNYTWDYHNPPRIAGRTFRDIYDNETSFTAWAMRKDQLRDPGHILRDFQDYVRRQVSIHGRLSDCSFGDTLCSTCGFGTGHDIHQWLPLGNGRWWFHLMSL